jgi:Holliday junction resolvase RusA-like endonuclease
MKFETIYTCALLLDPRPKERPRFTKMGFAYTPDKTKSFERIVSQALEAGFNSAAIERRPLRLEITFHIERPKTVKREYPTSRPDIDNLGKAIMDAANKILYKDDALICDLELKKRYSASSGYIELKLIALDCVIDGETLPV